MGKKDDGRICRKSYAEYGLTKERVKVLLGECHKGKHAAQLRAAAYQADQLTAEYIILSIMQKKSYDALEFNEKLGRVPCGRSDFYGIRRHTIAILDGMLPEGKKA